MATDTPDGFWGHLVGFCLRNRLVVGLVTLLGVAAALVVHPFDEWAVDGVPRHRVAVDAIPDIGENQQIVFTEWPGRSPKDIDDQITYPLTTQLLGLPGVRTVRSSSMFGFASVYVIFEDGVGFYWARSRILEKLAALPRGLLPEGVTPVLGPDATALGQVFWYTLEGRDPETGEVLGGFDLHELRTVQDWTVRPALQAASGVSEVASIGGYVAEFQIDVDPRKLEAYQVPITRLAAAVREANRDVGARTLEINRVEYVVRGVGQVQSLADLEQTVVAERDGRPLRVADLARVTLGPAQRRGALDVNGAEAVGGVVVARYGANPMAVVEAAKAAVADLAPGLPKRTLASGRTSQITLVPFYDRSQVVVETLGTLRDALWQQVLVTVVVVLVLLGNLRASLVISAGLPLAVGLTFVVMTLTGVTANVMSLAGIAIAIGTMVDMGIVLTERMWAAARDVAPGDRLAAMRAGAAEVAPAVATSTLTTVISFVPVFGLTASEGKLFHPLAYTKTFALVAALGLSVTVLPLLASALLPKRGRPLALRAGALAAAGAALMAWGHGRAGVAVLGLALLDFGQHVSPEPWGTWLNRLENVAAAALGLAVLTQAWQPLGGGAAFATQLAFVAGITLGLLLLFWGFMRVYPRVLRWALAHKVTALAAPALLVGAGLTAWLGAERTLSWLPDGPRAQALRQTFPGLGDEFMPPFDEGQFLFMPTVMPHASLGQALAQLRQVDAAIAAIPEVQTSVGKLGRVESALDPAPVSMFENVITYKPEYGTDAQGRRVRQWRDHIRSPDDIWAEVVAAADQPGLTSAPKLMPIQTRIVMLQSGMRAPLGLKVQAPDLPRLDQAVKALEASLRRAGEHLKPQTVFGEQVVGKPYLELHIDRARTARYGLSVEAVQRAIQVALGGVPLTTAILGRERVAVRVRYARGDRQDPEDLRRLLVPTGDGPGVPLEQLADVRFVKGPQAIKSEDTFLTAYLTFAQADGLAEVDAVEALRGHLADEQAAGALTLPEGTRFAFAGTYQQQQRSADRLRLLVPLALVLILLVLHLQFKRVSTTLMIYAGVAVAVAGAFLLLWAYGRSGFLDFELLGYSARDLFQVGPVNLSVAVWVGVIALVGIATDDGVVMATYLDQRFQVDAPRSVAQVREAVLAAGSARVRPCLMTTATTLLALLPVITSTGRGADVMIPMALPSLGGMAVELVTLFVVPVLYSAREEWRVRRA